jgi:hypothetical protein
VASLRRVGERREATQEEGVIWKKEGCCRRFFLQSSHDLLCSRAIPIGRPPLVVCTVAPRCPVAHDTDTFLYVCISWNRVFYWIHMTIG